MSTIVLSLKDQPSLPVEAEVVCPDRLAALPRPEIAALKVLHGNREHRLDDFFEIEGEAGDDIAIRGDLHRFKWIGKGMTRGRIAIEGNAGMHLGAAMRGGAIEVRGDAADWLGAEMRGGLIRVHGAAGAQVGGAYRGSLSGMKGGAILIAGSAGTELGRLMKRGTIVVGGQLSEFAGLQMKGGTLFLLDGGAARTGVWMTRGTIISMKPLPLLPTFAKACLYDPPFARIYARYLKGLGIALPVDLSQGAYRRYTGDNSVSGQGEVLVWEG